MTMTTNPNKEQGISIVHVLFLLSFIVSLAYFYFKDDTVEEIEEPTFQERTVEESLMNIETSIVLFEVDA
jgi:Tfp pilus assembly protein PilO